MELTPEILKLIALGIGAYFLLVFALGLANKAVIYFDALDFFISLLPWVLFVVAGAVSDIDNIKYSAEALSDQNSLIFFGILALAALCTLMSLKMSIQYNKNIFLGLLVWIFKITVSVLSVFLIAGMLDNKNQNKSADAFALIIVLGLFIWLRKKLFNGRAVYHAKGWELPNQQAVST